MLEIMVASYRLGTKPLLCKYKLPGRVVKLGTGVVHCSYSQSFFF